MPAASSSPNDSSLGSAVQLYQRAAKDSAKRLIGWGFTSGTTPPSGERLRA
jgi:hypothetical protein